VGHTIIYVLIKVVKATDLVLCCNHHSRTDHCV